jgi:hypothetical protein
MKICYALIIPASLALGVLIVPATSQGRGSNDGPAIGPDAALCQLFNTRSWGRVGDIHAYSIQTDTWNVGDQDLLWQEFTSIHPIMAQNIYRYKNGRLEQIGLSWVKHGFCALQQAGCGPCNVQGGCLDFLGVGCRDPYSANLNGNQFRLGPRSEVNASLGQYPYPYVLGWQQSGDAIYKRAQVHDTDINPAMNAGAKWYIEGQILHPQEESSDRRHNNPTYEQVLPTSDGANSFLLGQGFGTQQHLPAIHAWQANDPQVQIAAVDVPGEPVDGRFHLGYRVLDLGNGLWRYDYALHNLNSHRSAQAFTVPLNQDADVFNTFHRDVKYHSGEVYTNEDWTLTEGATSVSWSGQTFAVNENANALRWGTMFNFSVIANAAPVMGTVNIGLFRPGTPESVDVAALVPTGGAAPVCLADINNDDNVGVADLLAVINGWGACPAFPTPCPADVAPPGGDGSVGVGDLLAIISAWGACP